ncbi:C-terminal binding protein AN-like isoform X2 [Musa acuminata AAA Group]|uniref:C-terminal binding protein AN-like isoform X2 n=1 Tax=Musa acuminata AAA Group TaxID=214697 RepID=UPI0031DDF74D
MHHGSAGRSPSERNRMAAELPLVVGLNCLKDASFEEEALAGTARVEHVGLSALADGRIESAAAVVLHSLSLVPGPAQRRLRPWQLVLCLGSADRAVDSALAADLGLRLVHVDASRAEEVADTVMALFLSLLRRTHLLSRDSSSSASAGWLGSIQPLCRGMRRCRGLVLGIIGRSASARCLATRSLAFKMSVLYFDLHHEGKEKSGRPVIPFPPAARRMDTLNDLLALSDLVSLHCSLSDATLHILNSERLQHIKPGAFIVNTGSTQLIDDCALKQLLIDGTIAGCALDGAEGPQWMEAWVREMPNVLILPRSADYSEEVWMEIREKAITILQSFFLDGIVPDYAVSDEDETINESAYEDEQAKKQEKEPQQVQDVDQLTGESKNTGSRTEGRHSGSGKKGKKRPARRRSQQNSDDSSAADSASGYTSGQDDDTAISGRDKISSSNSRFASSEDPRNKQMCIFEQISDLSSGKQVAVSTDDGELLKDGFVVALRAIDRPGYHVSRQRIPGGGWFLDTVSNISKRDPAAQFLVSFKSKDILGLQSFAAGGKLLQINRKMEFVFANHSFDVCGSWTLQGSVLEQCKLINCKNPLAVLEVSIEILAAVAEDGISRWLD